MTSKPISATRSRRSRGGEEGAGGDRAGLLVAGGALGAREELVPAAEERADPVGAEAEGSRDGRELAERVGPQHGVEVRVLQGGEPRARGAFGVGRCRDRPGDAGGGGLVERVVTGGGGDPLEQQAGLGEHQLDVHAGRDLDAAVVLPGRDRVGPGMDLEGPLALDVGRDVGEVAVGLVALEVHAHRGSASARRVDRDHLGAELVVALAEHRGADGHRLTDGGLR